MRQTPSFHWTIYPQRLISSFLSAFEFPIQPSLQKCSSLINYPKPLEECQMLPWSQTKYQTFLKLVPNLITNYFIATIKFTILDYTFFFTRVDMWKKIFLPTDSINTIEVFCSAKFIMPEFKPTKKRKIELFIVTSLSSTC